MLVITFVVSSANVSVILTTPLGVVILHTSAFLVVEPVDVFFI